MTDPRIEAATTRARQKIGELTTGELPIKPQSVDKENLLLTMLEGNLPLVVEIIKNIAQNEFGLSINADGLIDLPPGKTVTPAQTLNEFYISPTIVPGIPPLPDNRPRRKGKIQPDEGQK